MTSRNHSLPEELDSMQIVRNQIVDAVLILAGIMGVISLGLFIMSSPDIIRSAEGIGLIALTGIVAGLAVYRRRVPYKLKALLIIIAIYGAGLLNLINHGLIGSNSIMFIVVILFSMIFYDNRSGFIAFAIVVISLIIASISLNAGILSFDLDFDVYARSQTSWVSRMVLITLVSALILASLGRILGVLQQQLSRLQQHSNELTLEMKKREEAEARLAEAIGQLKELDHLKDNFIDSASHELRTPVANIQLYHQLIGMKPEKQAEYMQTLKKETDRLSYIIEQMIHASSDNYDMTLTTLVDIELQHLVKQLFKEEADILAAKQIRLTLPEGEDEYIIMAAPEHIYRALSNLVDNAVKYTPAEGQILVDMQRATHGKQEMLGVMIRNTGECLSDAERKTIFDRFVRGETSLKEGVPGAGLGLSIARQIVEKYRGRIELACDEIDGKLAFTVWLPPVVPMAEILSDDNPVPETSI